MGVWGRSAQKEMLITLASDLLVAMREALEGRSFASPSV